MVGRQGRGRQTRRGTSPGQELLPLLRGRRSKTGSTPQRGTALHHRVQDPRGTACVPPRQGPAERGACDVVRPAGLLGQAPVLHGARVLVSQGRRTPALVGHTRAASAGGATRAPGLGWRRTAAVLLGMPARALVAGAGGSRGSRLTGRGVSGTAVGCRGAVTASWGGRGGDVGGRGHHSAAPCQLGRPTRACS